MDEVISSSQKRPKGSIHKSRTQRKSRRQRMNSRTLGDAGESHEEKFVDILYEDGSISSQNKEINQTLIGQWRLLDADYDVFQEQKLITIADHQNYHSQSQEQRQAKMQFTQNFQKAQDLIARKSDDFVIDEPMPISPTLAEINISCLDVHSQITESELLSICEKAELDDTKYESVTSNSMLTPHSEKSKSIVKLILDDFCSSPFSPEVTLSPKCSPADIDITPVFNFKNKSLRTYSRRSAGCAKKNIEKDLFKSAIKSSPSPIPDEDILSCSSGLSIQEDLMQSLQPNIQAIELDSSEKLCDNLLNLSAFFTQPLEEDTATKTKSSKIIGCDVGRIQTPIARSPKPEQNKNEDIVPPQRNKPALNRRLSCSFEEFHGFGNTETEAVLQRLVHSCPSSNSIFYHYSPKRGVTMRVNDAEGELRAIAINNCDVDEKKDNHISTNPVFVVGDDEWNEDDELFKNLCTQVALKHSTIQKESNQSSSAIEKSSKQVKNGPANQFKGFQTASNKSIEVSKEARERAEWILQELPELPKFNASGQRTESVIDNHKPASSNSAFINKQGPINGFSITTNIHIDEMQTSNKLCKDEHIDLELKNLDFGHWDFDKEIGTDLQNRAKTNAFVGFQTASRKTITVSDEAKASALNILAELPLLHEPNKRQYGSGDSNQKLETDANAITTYTQSRVGGFNNFVGFQTGSTIKIEISEEANAKEASSLADLSDLTQKFVPLKEENTQKVAEEYMNIQLSEWFPSQDMLPAKSPIKEKRNKRKLFSEKESLHNTPRQEAKIVCKSLKSDPLTRTPLNRIDNGLLQSISPDLPRRSPRNLSNKSNLISRKNLLSLSKRRKKQPDQDDKMSGDTPNKHRMPPSSLNTIVRTPGTPDLCTFVNALPTTSVSTPRINLQMDVVEKSSIGSAKVDDGFKEIKWEINNDSQTVKESCTSKTRCAINIKNSCDNLSFDESKMLSPQQRIERLSVYDNPPTLSPVVTVVNATKVRSLGLKRRSRLSKGSVT